MINVNTQSSCFEKTLLRKEVALMKKIIVLVLAVCMLTSMLALPVSAGGSCNGNHGPWTYYCSHIVSNESNNSHTFVYQGSVKTCYYRTIFAYTDRRCDYCLYHELHVDTHSHGDRDHATGCGMTNGDNWTCALVN